MKSKFTLIEDDYTVHRLHVSHASMNSGVLSYQVFIVICPFHVLGPLSWDRLTLMVVLQRRFPQIQ